MLCVAIRVGLVENTAPIDNLSEGIGHSMLSGVVWCLSGEERLTKLIWCLSGYVKRDKKKKIIGTLIIRGN